MAQRERERERERERGDLMAQPACQLTRRRRKIPVAVLKTRLVIYILILLNIYF
jgi:hypothetical protein